MEAAIREFVLGTARSSVEAAGQAATAPAGPVSILFTDITDSTALTQRLGDAKAQELVRAHNAIVREALRAHGGSEIKHTGDGIMASFSSSSSALECAIAIQRAVADRADDLGAPLGVHIGLNAGEPVAEENDLYGTSVQLARRICDQAGGGEVLVSDVVRQLVAGKGFLFADRGDVALRGFEDPVRLYELRWRDDA
jgi:adenylate cyclase